MREPTGVRILAWMCVLIAVNQLGFGSIVPALALYARSFDVTQSAIGLAIAVYGLARFLVAVPAGRLADGLGRRRTLAVGGLLSAAGNALCALAPTYATFVGARFVAGAGAALVLTTGLIVIADISTPANRGRMMSAYQGVFIFAVGIGPLPGGLLASHWGLAAPFVAYAVTSLLASAVAWLAVPETRAVRRADEPATTEAPYRAQLRLLTSHRGFMLVSLIAFVNAVARTGALFNIIPILARDRLSLDTDRIGFGLALASIVGLALAYPAGVLVDRYGRKIIIVPATILSGLSLVLFLRAPGYAWFLAACAAWSIAMGISGAAPAAYAADAAPAGMNAAALSTYRMLADLGYVVGPIALGLAADLAGADAALGGTAILLVSVALLFARFAPETYRGGRF
ncbi:MAG TPA: MFS transporter [Candidatus Deferrimicrobiaceae bacterium]|nr:MFS transporter [Candidatus Deferrimicrobiaceae bacterium]